MNQKEFLKKYISEKEINAIDNLPESVNDFTEKDWETYHLQGDIYTLDRLSKLPKNTKIYCILKHVSSSGMMRIIDLFYIKDNTPVKIHFATGKIFDKRHNKTDDKAGFRVGGCGMDMGFHLVHSLSYLVSKYATGESDGYYFKQEWI